MQEHPPSGMFNVTIRLSTHCTILQAKGMSLQIDSLPTKSPPVPTVLLSKSPPFLLSKSIEHKNMAEK